MNHFLSRSYCTQYLCIGYLHHIVSFC